MTWNEKHLTNHWYYAIVHLIRRQNPYSLESYSYDHHREIFPGLHLMIAIKFGWNAFDQVSNAQVKRTPRVMLVDKEAYILDEDLWAKFQWGFCLGSLGFLGWPYWNDWWITLNHHKIQTTQATLFQVLPLVVGWLHPNGYSIGRNLSNIGLVLLKSLWATVLLYVPFWGVLGA